MNPSGTNGGTVPPALTAEEKREASIRIGKRRMDIAGLVLQRVPIREIARRMEVSTRTAARDLQKLREQWSREAGTRIDLLIGEEFASINQDELVLRIMMQNETDGGKKLAIFDRIAKLGEARRKLLGLDAATKLGVSFEGQLGATLEIRDAEFYKTMLKDPEARAVMLSRYRHDSGMDRPPQGVNPYKQNGAALSNGNGHATNGAATDVPPA